MNVLSELFPSEDYRFHLRLRRGEASTFFAPTAGGEKLLAERRHWLNSDRDRHAQLLPPAVPLLAELAVLTGRNPSMTAENLGAELEPDFLLLSADESGIYRLQGGVVCFPSGWALAEKMGHSIDWIHDTVPGLNSALAAPIHQFLARLQPGPAYLRANWGLAATAELNLHPALARPRLAEPLDAAAVWLRVERQVLARLPRSGGVLFGIRVDVHPLVSLLEDPALRAGFHRALTTMPDELAAYKGLEPVMEGLLNLSKPE